METGQLKRFAIDSRNILKRGVSQRLTALGINPDGTAEYQPVQVQGGTLFMDNTYDEPFYDKWMDLYAEVQTKSYKDVVEEAAYTWFNRLVAIRILQKNGLISPVLAYVSPDSRVPVIVAEARSGKLRTEIIPEDRDRFNALVRDSAKTQKLFAVLIRSYCRNMPVINACFGGITHFYELLLPDDILSSGGFIDLLNNTQYISDDDFKKTELIGWLYQFYISEKKDAVFAAGGKVEKEDIPAATQIFTPNWIVKYMVENTIGKIWLDNNPWSELKSEMKYLVPSQEKEKPENILRLKSLEEYTMADMACGSGHILNEGFDLLYKMYQEDGYSPKNAIESIFRYNLTGIDLDTRAKQLATFSLLLKSLQIVPSFIDCHILPRVYDMPKALPENFNLTRALNNFFMGDQKAIGETFQAFELLKQADNLGSIMKFDMLSPATIGAIQLRLKEQEQVGISDEVKVLEAHLRIIVALTTKYAAVVENPPYMAYSNMNSELSNYIARHFSSAKYDLFSVFMVQSMSLLANKGKLGMINMQSWMFLSAFERLRREILDSYNISSLIHLGPHTFDELGGEVVQNVAFSITNSKPTIGGIYQRLISGNTCSEKEELFFDHSLSFRVVNQKRFERIPGSPVAYWVGDEFIDSFNNKKIDDYSEVITGMTIGDNNKYLRLWPEVNRRKIAIEYDNMDRVNISRTNWIPYSKGGGMKQWYGNHEYVVNWAKKENFNRAKTTLSHLYLKEAVTWPFITSGRFSARFLPKGSLWDVAGSPCFFESHRELLYTLGFMTSKIADLYLHILNPTINVQAADIRNLPLIGIDRLDSINLQLVENSINISKQDWDSHETSWDFQENELIRAQSLCRQNVADMDMLPAEEIEELHKTVPYISGLVSHCVAAYKSDWERKFQKLHSNEEELNRQFIEIYGLQNELTPDVPLSEITILQQGEISIENGKDGERLVWHEDVLMKQLLSYALGCMFGRYRLDRPGLHIAHPNPSADELAPYDYKKGTFAIDDDAIIPLLPKDSPFPDNAYNRVREFIKLVFGEEHLTENFNYIEKALGKPLDEYLEKDFWNYHKKMYQNKPIYWLFSSPKGAFKAVVYMHRFGKYTPELVRSKYLLPYIEHLQERIRSYNDRAAHLTTAERRTVASLEKALAECLAYNDVLHDVADRQMGIDLDDGVAVNYPKFAGVLAKIK